MTASAARLIATWFGCGRVPIAPGTAGSLAAVAIAVLLARYLGWKGWHFALLTAFLAYPAVWASTRAAREAGARDPSFVVVDEVLGQWLALAPAAVLSWNACAAAFLLFRFFDIVKPPPVRQMEKLPAGWGIVGDDLAAGAYAALVLYLPECFNLY